MIKNILSRRNRILLRELVITDFKLRYQGSVLGYLWSLLKPLMLFAILYVVFVNFLKIGADIEHFAVYLLVGVVMWTFFIEATMQGMSAIVSRGDLIRKINFPKYIIVISGTISALINLLLNLLVVLVFMFINGVHFQWTMFYVPLNLIELYVIALAVAFFLSAAYVKYRDVSHIWEVFMQGAFYATPIIYPVQMIAGKDAHTITDVLASSHLWVVQLVMLNPVAQVIQDVRYNAVTHGTIKTQHLFSNPFWIILPYIMVFVIVLCATIYFRRSQKYFAENV